MKYTLNAAKGNAGEFFFAYKIASVLNWPCRLIDIDIGIDAQVEIINDDRSSTGRFVAFQVKATSAKEAKCRYVSEEQLNYWRELALPVFVVLVNLSQQTMYMHRVDLSQKYPISADGGVRIDFDLVADLFSADSARLISDAATEAARSHVETLLLEVRAGSKEIRDAIEAQSDCADASTLIEQMEKRNAVKEKLAQAQAVADSLGVGTPECDSASNDLEDALQELRDFMERGNMHVDWAENGDIARFIKEGR